MQPAIEIPEKPILFKPHLIKAILEDRKHVTRRIINRVLGIGKVTEFQKSDTPGYDWIMRDKRMLWNDLTHSELLERCPYGKAGHNLWAREVFWCQNDTCDHEYCGGCDCGSMLSCGPDPGIIDYIATPECFNPPKLKWNQKVNLYDGKPVPGYWWLGPNDDYDGNSDYEKEGVWEFLPWRYYTKHPSIHMPRWASRLNLNIKSIGVEPIQDITLSDIIEEGVCASSMQDPTDIADELRDGFRDGWNLINGKRGYSWESNPWVWVIEFKRDV